MVETIPTNGNVFIFGIACTCNLAMGTAISFTIFAGQICRAAVTGTFLATKHCLLSEALGSRIPGLSALEVVADEDDDGR